MFRLGFLAITPGAFYKIGASGARELLSRHWQGDWSDMSDDGKAQNKRAVENGDRIFSSYNTEHGEICVITEADRSATTILLPEEY